VSAFLLTLTASAFWNGKTLRKTTTWMTETTDACFKAKRLRDQALRLVRSEGRASGNNSGVSLNTNADDLASNTYCRAILMHLQLKPPGLLLSRFWSASTA